jgi:hypothetical protein
MTEFTDENGKQWKIVGPVISWDPFAMGAHNGSYVPVEEASAPDDDWAIQAAVRIWGEVVQVIQSSERGVPKVAAIIRDCAPKPASETTLLKAALECADDLELWQTALRDIADTVEMP